MFTKGPVFNTDGSGYWSRKKAAVQILGFALDIYENISENSKLAGELMVFFDPAAWDVKVDGLIYTDNQWLSELQSWLQNQGVEGYVEYSEQGMQGSNFVSLDVDYQFIQSMMQTIKIVGSIDSDAAMLPSASNALHWTPTCNRISLKNRITWHCRGFLYNS